MNFEISFAKGNFDYITISYSNSSARAFELIKNVILKKNWAVVMMI